MTFLKWIGGKSQLLPELSELLPDMNKIKGYMEPFLGGGSVFFYLMENFNDSLSKKNIYISDVNSELINCYKVVRDNIVELLPLLQKHQDEHCEDYYYEIRDSYFSVATDIERAAAFIYLNKTCFNGLWRINKDGKPNAAIGQKGKIDIYNRDIMRSSSLLKSAHISVMSFEKILDIKDIEGYFVYLDPPYYTVDHKGNFTRYTADDFHLSKRLLVPKVFKELDRLGCKVMLSNSYSNIIQKEFKDFNIKTLKAKRIVNSDVKNRGHVYEVVVMNYQEYKRQKTIEEAWG
jgi:DNA adenine methylase